MCPSRQVYLAAGEATEVQLRMEDGMDASDGVELRVGGISC